jgi:hypothetical protein
MQGIWSSIQNSRSTYNLSNFSLKVFEEAINELYNKDMKTELKEGIDYLLEDGKVVFTSKFHKDRGFCCGNKCRYCPYTEQVKGNTELDKDLDYEYTTLDTRIPF